MPSRRMPFTARSLEALKPADAVCEVRETSGEDDDRRELR